jgi:hypothetical protein
LRAFVRSRIAVVAGWLKKESCWYRMTTIIPAPNMTRQYSIMPFGESFSRSDHSGQPFVWRVTQNGSEHL